MAAPFSASRFVQILREEGLVVHEYRSWRTHNRNHKGRWGPINGVMIHHTVTRGTESSVRLCYDGHSTLPGPLCHGVIDKRGEVWLVGNGRANHAGSGDDDVLDAVIDERDAPGDNEANTDGNARFYGFECINMGDGQDPWPEEQLLAIEKAGAAICRAYGWDAASVIGHLEWQPGKVDPRGFGMDWMRGRIARRLDNPPNKQKDQEDDDMDMSTQVPISGWVQKRWDDKGLKDGRISMKTALGSGYAHSRRAAEASEATLAELGAMRATVDKLADAIAGGGGLTAAEIRAAAEEGAQAALNRLGTTLIEEN